MKLLCLFSLVLGSLLAQGGMTREEFDDYVDVIKSAHYAAHVLIEISVIGKEIDLKSGKTTYLPTPFDSFFDPTVPPFALCWGQPDVSSSSF